METLSKCLSFFVPGESIKLTLSSGSNAPAYLFSQLLFEVFAEDLFLSLESTRWETSEDKSLPEIKGLFFRNMIVPPAQSAWKSVKSFSPFANKGLQKSPNGVKKLTWHTKLDMKESELQHCPWEPLCVNRAGYFSEDSQRASGRAVDLADSVKGLTLTTSCCGLHIRKGNSGNYPEFILENSQSLRSLISTSKVWQCQT